MATGKRRDWAHRHNFLVEIDGSTEFAFQEVSGLEYGFEVVEYREGGDWTTTRKFQGQAAAGNITLKRGLLAKADSLRAWVQSSARPDPLVRRSGSIVLIDDAGKEIKRWNFTRSWPVSWRLQPLESNGHKDLAIEELVIAVDTLELHEGGASGAKKSAK